MLYLYVNYNHSHFLIFIFILTLGAIQQHVYYASLAVGIENTDSVMGGIHNAQ